MKLGSCPVSSWRCLNSVSHKWNADKPFSILLSRAAMLKAAMVVAVILTESMRGCTWYPYSSQLSVCRKVAFLIWASSEAGDYVLAEQEVDAQEKMSRAKKINQKTEQQEEDEGLCHWLIHLTGVLENSLMRKQLSKGFLWHKVS